MNNTNHSLYIFLKEHEGKKVRVLTKNNFSYITTDLKVFEDSILFHDKFGREVLLALSEVAQLTGVKDGY